MIPGPTYGDRVADELRRRDRLVWAEQAQRADLALAAWHPSPTTLAAVRRHAGAALIRAGKCLQGASHLAPSTVTTRH